MNYKDLKKLLGRILQEDPNEHKSLTDMLSGASERAYLDDSTVQLTYEKASALNHVLTYIDSLNVKELNSESFTYPEHGSWEPEEGKIK